MDKRHEFGPRHKSADKLVAFGKVGRKRDFFGPRNALRSARLPDALLVPLLVGLNVNGQLVHFGLCENVF